MTTIPATATGTRATLVRNGEAAGWTRIFACPGYDVLARGAVEITVWYTATGKAVTGAQMAVWGGSKVVATAKRGRIDTIGLWFNLEPFEVG